MSAASPLIATVTADLSGRQGRAKSGRHDGPSCSVLESQYGPLLRRFHGRLIEVFGTMSTWVVTDSCIPGAWKRARLGDPHLRDKVGPATILIVRGLCARRAVMNAAKCDRKFGERGRGDRITDLAAQKVWTAHFRSGSLATPAPRLGTAAVSSIADAWHVLWGTKIPVACSITPTAYEHCRFST
jgi:hypothetical protein